MNFHSSIKVEVRHWEVPNNLYQSVSPESVIPSSCFKVEGSTSSVSCVSGLFILLVINIQPKTVFDRPLKTRTVTIKLLILQCFVFGLTDYMITFVFSLKMTKFF